jgi:hypothetical protein
MELHMSILPRYTIARITIVALESVTSITRCPLLREAGLPE